jgi:hypothetical protein
VPLSCHHCNLPFESRWEDQRYCSTACRKAVKAARAKKPPAPKQPDLRPCSECLALFLTYSPTQETCSKQCGYDRNCRIKRELHGAPRREFPCACCGAPCVSASARARFCSRACAVRAKKRRDRGKPERSPVLPPRSLAPSYRGKGAKNLASC